MGAKRQFNDEFKRNAVRMVLEKGIPVKKVARDLDVHPNLILKKALGVFSKRNW
jgi:transposase-like protein